MMIPPGKPVGIRSPLIDDLDFAQFQAIAMTCDNGSTLPATPATGQWFLHIPTGRNILYMYNDSSWIPIISLGAMTVYVDSTDGTDSLDKGYGVDADAFKTIQFAVGAIPGVVGGNVIINVNNETYAEQITIQGKNFTGNFTITLQGVLNQQATATQDSSVQGSGAIQGSITDSGAFGSFDNLLLYSSNNDQYRIIDSDNANTATIVSTWDAAPSGTYTVYDWGTKIDGGASRDFCLHVLNGQKGIVVNDIEFEGANLNNVFLDGTPSAEFNRCKSHPNVATSEGFECDEGSILNLNSCLIAPDGNSTNGVRFARRSSGRVDACKIYRVSGTGTQLGLDVRQSSIVQLSPGSIIDGFTFGSRSDQGSTVNWSTNAANGYSRIRNCTTGLFAQFIGQHILTSTNQYSGNTTNKNPSGASDPSYID